MGRMFLVMKLKMLLICCCRVILLSLEVGHQSTWSNNGLGDSRIDNRIDRCLDNSSLVEV